MQSPPFTERKQKPRAFHALFSTLFYTASPTVLFFLLSTQAIMQQKFIDFDFLSQSGKNSKLEWYILLSLNPSLFSDLVPILFFSYFVVQDLIGEI